MKRILAFLFIFLLTAAAASAASLTLEYDGGTHVYNGNVYALSVNGTRLYPSLEPIIFNNRALVPLRDVFEAAGAKVNYNNSSRGIYIEGNGVRLLMQIGSDTVTINGKQQKFPDGIAPKLIAKKGASAKTMVPVRFISETLGYSVDFNGSSININTSYHAPTLKSIYCRQSGGSVVISVTADRAIGSVSEPNITPGGVLYVDIYNAGSNLPSQANVGLGAVTRVRTGEHTGYTRIALDVTNLKDYSMQLSSDRKTVMIGTLTNSDDTSSAQKIVVIDAGHGGKDAGTGREFNGTRVNEKDINLAVAQKTVDILRSNGVTVEMTRTGDTYPELTERSAFANSLNAAIFVSIHSNSAESVPDANGVEVYYATENNSSAYGVKSSELADKILKAILTHTNANNRKVKTARHVVTRTCSMPATLVEIGFVTNDTELSNLLNSDYQYKLAAGIAEGIMKCLPKITIPGSSGIAFDENNLGNKIS